MTLALRASAAVPRDADRGTSLRDRLAGLLTVLAIATFLLFHRLGQPAQPIWDESYYLTATARYELRNAQFASHPPLGLMLIAAGNHVSGANAGVDWAPIAAGKKIAGERMPMSFSYAGVRCASALFGVIAAGLFFLLMLAIAGRADLAFVLTAPLLFDTALIAQFRAAQLDAFQMCFAVAALLCLILGDRRRTAGLLVGFGAACGLATMVRANGVLLLAGAALPMLRAAAVTGDWRARAMRIIGTGTAIGGAFAMAVAAVFLAHVVIADRAMPSGWAAASADAPYVSPTYRAYLDGEAPLSVRTVLDAAEGYSRFMAADVAAITRVDRNGSSPWSWPLGRRPIMYRWDSNGRTTAFVAMAPNLASWAVSLAGIIAAGLAVLRRGPARSSSAGPGRPLLLTLLLLWATLFLSDAWLAGMRVMYLYHYLLPLLVGWTLAAIGLADRQVGRWDSTVRIVMVGAILAVFVDLAPLALHQPLTDRSCRLRTALSGGDLCNHQPSKAA